MSTRTEYTNNKRISSKMRFNIGVRLKLLFWNFGIFVKIAATTKAPSASAFLLKAKRVWRGTPNCRILSGAVTSAKIDYVLPVFLDRTCLCALQNTLSKNTAILPSQLPFSRTHVRATAVAPRFPIGGVYVCARVVGVLSHVVSCIDIMYGLLRRLQWTLRLWSCSTHGRGDFLAMPSEARYLWL